MPRQHAAHEQEQLVVAECALATVLLVGAALLLRSFWRVQHVDAGFDGRNVLTARLWLPQPNDPKKGKYFTHPARLALFNEVLRRVRALPGVESAAAVQSLPLDGLRGATTITVDGRDSEVSGQIPTVQVNLASADYFQVMGVRVLRRPPRNPRPASWPTLLREARILGALTYVPLFMGLREVAVVFDVEVFGPLDRHQSRSMMVPVDSAPPAHMVISAVL